MNSTKFIISGKVQGVAFRYYTHQKALELGLKGFVSNQKDTTVIVMAQGKFSDIQKLHKWLYQGSPASQVDNVKMISIESDEFDTFIIKR